MYVSQSEIIIDSSSELLATRQILHSDHRLKKKNRSLTIVHANKQNNTKDYQDFMKTFNYGKELCQLLPFVVFLLSKMTYKLIKVFR